MPITNAVGTSLVVVSALGLTTAASYATSGMVNWPITALMFASGAAGTIAGTAASRALYTSKGLLERSFALIVIAVGLYVVATAL